MSARPAPFKTLLSSYRPLAPSASVKVSPLCLGSTNFGYACAGNYQKEQSETWISYRTYRSDEIQANFVRNSTRNLRLSVEASLKKLRTSYMDLWEFGTSIEEVTQSLNQLVISRKVLYLGISDTPALVVSKANQYARDHGLWPFPVYLGRWSAASRDFERDIIPMAQSEGMGICAWCALGGGNFKSAEREALQSDGNPGRKLAPPSLIDITIFEALERIAKRYNTSLTAVAFAYVMLKAPYSYPIPGGRKVEHLKGNIAALEIALTTEDIEGIEGAAPIHTGFPMNFLTQGQAKEVGPASILFTKMAGHFDSLKAPVAIRPKKE